MRALHFVMILLIVQGPQMAGRQKPDFSGEWTLDRAASRLEAPTDAVESGEVRIDHHDPDFSFSRTFMVKGQRLSDAWKTTSDGREDSRQGPGPTGRSRLVWDGDALLLTVLLTTPAGEVRNVVRYELLEGARVLRAAEDVTGPGVEHHNVWIYRR